MDGVPSWGLCMPGLWVASNAGPYTELDFLGHYTTSLELGQDQGLASFGWNACYGWDGVSRTFVREYTTLPGSTGWSAHTHWGLLQSPAEYLQFRTVGWAAAILWVTRPSPWSLTGVESTVSASICRPNPPSYHTWCYAQFPELNSSPSGLHAPPTVTAKALALAKLSTSLSSLHPQPAMTILPNVMGAHRHSPPGISPCRLFQTSSRNPTTARVPFPMNMCQALSGIMHCIL
jgi:hypothetical protein